VSPSLTPKKPGERIKTDTRDAIKLARLARAGELTAIYVPEAADEALRDLVRACEGVVAMQHQARHRLQALLLRNDIRYVGKTAWTPAYQRVAELGDLTRFGTPRAMMGFLGLVPPEHSSGGKRAQDAITKAGSVPVQRPA